MRRDIQREIARNWNVYNVTISNYCSEKWITNYYAIREIYMKG